MRIVLVLIMIVLAVAGTLSVEVSPVYACSGPTPRFDVQIDSATHVIKSHVIQSDAARKNHLVQVEEYLTGGPGPEFTMLVQNTPATIQGFHDQQLGVVDCYFRASTPPANDAFYMLVERRVDGAYVQIRGNAPELYTFPTPDATEYVYVAEPPEAGPWATDAVTLTEPEFRALVAEYAGVSPVPPLPDQPTPRMQPGLITTQAGTRYVLPVDGTPPVPIDHPTLARMLVHWPVAGLLSWPDDACRDTSAQPECSFEVVDDRFVRQTVNGEPHKLLSPYGLSLALGDDLLGGPGGVTAVWQGDTLTIYAMHNPQPQYLGTREPPVSAYASTPIEPQDVDYPSSRAAWSPDGQFLAYADQAGVWLWDVFGGGSDHRAPELLISAEDGPVWPLTFSPQGRYLAVASDSDRWMLDRLTGDVLPYGVWSPDERLFLVRANDAHYWELRSVAPPAAYTPLYVYSTVQWLDNRHFITAICNTFVAPDCVVWYGDAYTVRFGAYYPMNDTFWATQQIEPGRAFWVSAAGDVAVQVDDTTLSINRQPMTLDLDAPIAEFRWLGPLFWSDA